MAPPGSSVALTVVGWPTSTFTACTTVFLKPGPVTATVYVPFGADGMAQLPSSPDVALNSCLVSFETATTSAPTTTAPCVSVTTPVRRPEVVIWAKAAGTDASTSARDRQARPKERLLISPS